MNIGWRVLAIALATLACEPAKAACVTPGGEALLGHWAVGCCTSVVGRLGGAGPDLRWVAVNSEGPPDGALYVVDCRGGKAAKTDRLGYVERMAPGPSVGGLPTVAVTHLAATGTGIKVRSVALIQYRGEQPRILWDHATFEGTYPPPNLGQSYEDRMSWRFLRGYRSIEVTTVRRVLGRSRTELKLPAERYCFRESIWRYVACK